MSHHHRPLRVFGVAALALGGVLWGASSASAHVTVDPSSTTAGSYTVLTVSVPHGCGDLPTTRIAMSIPEGINSVTPTRHPFYDVETVMTALAEPLDDGHGGELTERVSEVVYTANDPLPSDQRDAFELSFQLPDGSAGDVLTFPTVQTCDGEEAAWIEESVEGQPEPDMPAPVVVLTANESTDDAEATSDDGNAALAWTGIALGAAALATGAFAVTRTRRSS